jgi:hypothetical protein
MSPEKTILQEIAQDSIAIQQSRSEPIQQAPQQKSMDFLKSLVLGIPQQVLQDQPVKESNDVINTSPVVGDKQDESLDLLKHLAGIR